MGLIYSCNFIESGSSISDSSIIGSFIIGSFIIGSFIISLSNRGGGSVGSFIISFIAFVS